MILLLLLAIGHKKYTPCEGLLLSSQMTHKTPLLHRVKPKPMALCVAGVSNLFFLGKNLVTILIHLVDKILLLGAGNLGSA
jgi:hypothetical protein